MHPFSNHVIQSRTLHAGVSFPRGAGGVVLQRYFFVMKKVFNYSELHFSKVTYKIHPLMVSPDFQTFRRHCRSVTGR